MNLCLVCPTQEMDTPCKLDEPGIRGVGEQLDFFLCILEAEDDIVGSLDLINIGFNVSRSASLGCLPGATGQDT